MSLAGQRLDPRRYTVVPRTLSFLVRGDEVLLLRLGTDRGDWAGRLNGLGGHIEPGEDVLTSARREIREEAELSPGDLRLCGVVMIDVGPPGIGLFVLVGTLPSDAMPQGGLEGRPEWVRLDRLHQSPLVEDLPTLIPRALACYASREVFLARYQYAEDGGLRISFADGAA
jgi:8-oxo-dGTP diphosphatase